MQTVEITNSTFENRVDPDQTAPIKEQSDMSLHCFPLCLLLLQHTAEVLQM